MFRSLLRFDLSAATGHEIIGPGKLLTFKAHCLYEARQTRLREGSAVQNMSTFGERRF